MPVTAIVGAQWGDEGKGKITDILAQDADLVVRYGGGSNAGHTVLNQYGHFRLHLVPSGIFNPDAVSLVGTGTVVDFGALIEELSDLARSGVSSRNLRISSRAHVVMPYHLVLDRLGDEARGKEAIGTTRRGVGPAYVDKADRIGIQAGDVLDPDAFRRKLSLVLPMKNRILQEVFRHPPMAESDIVKAADTWRERFGPLIVDQVSLVSEALVQNQRVLLEGQLGALRDLDWGTYPYVTSSTTIAGGGAVGGGVPARYIDRVVGVVKAYTSAVGAGPVPTEMVGAEGEDLRARGDEYGATTGRPRRVGWFDAVATRYACTLNGFTDIAVTKLDVLDGLSPLKICTGYRLGDRRFTTVPSTTTLEDLIPEYEEVDGWTESTSDASDFDSLPGPAQRYLRRIEDLVGAPVSMVSVGQAREQTILYAGVPL